MNEDKKAVLLKCFGSIGVGALIGFMVPAIACLVVFHGTVDGGGLIRVALLAVCTPVGALVGTARALSTWRAYVAGGGN